MGSHLGIDFGAILVDFGRQVGLENQAKIDPKWHQKTDEKKKVTKMAKMDCYKHNKIKQYYSKAQALMSMRRW